MRSYEMNGRPLKIIHGFGFKREDGREKREQIIDAVLERLYRLGYGGIVTNVDLDMYLESPENWESLRYAIGRAFEKGFRVWLYDEHGYPSGGAGGITLRDHPDYEARALVEVTAEGKPGETVTVPLPRGHEYFIWPEQSPKTGTEGRVCVKAGEDGIARAYAVKRVYEGTHAQHNVHESRRYVNLLDPDAVRAFIENTYEAYKRELGPLFSRIEAIFTDEPSLMATYLNFGLYPGRVHDQFDDTLPLLPMIVWDRRLPEKYKEKWGTDLLPDLPALFGPPDPHKREIRYKFFTVTSEMYENAFFKQIGDWCEAAGTNFSGHVLLEEGLLLHPLFEGNIFRFISHMGIPGIDMLTTIPEGVLGQAVTPKLISSAAHLNGQYKVMSEVSGHMEGALHRNYGVNEMKGSVALQHALGVTEFPSYYNEAAVTEEEFQDFCRFTGNICRLTEPDNFNPAMTHRVLLLYPIEAAFASSKGSDRQGGGEHTPDELKVEESWQRLNRKLLLSGIEYECIDLKGLLEAAHIDHGSVFCGDLSFKGIVLPYVNYETPEMQELLSRLAKAGVVTACDTEGTEDAAKCVISQLKTGLQEKAGVYPAVEIIDHAPETGAESPLVVSSWMDTRYFRLAFLLVNYTYEPFDSKIKLSIPTWTGVKEGTHVICVDPDDGVFCHQDGTFEKRPGDSYPDGSYDMTFEFKANIRPLGALVVGFR